MEGTCRKTEGKNRKGKVQKGRQNWFTVEQVVQKLRNYFGFHLCELRDVDILEVKEKNVHVIVYVLVRKEKCTCILPKPRSRHCVS